MYWLSSRAMSGFDDLSDKPMNAVANHAFMSNYAKRPASSSPGQTSKIRNRASTDSIVTDHSLDNVLYDVSKRKRSTPKHLLVKKLRGQFYDALDLLYCDAKPERSHMDVDYMNDLIRRSDMIDLEKSMNSLNVNNGSNSANEQRSITETEAIVRNQSTPKCLMGDKLCGPLQHSFHSECWNTKLERNLKDVDIMDDLMSHSDVGDSAKSMNACSLNVANGSNSAKAAAEVIMRNSPQKDPYFYQCGASRLSRIARTSSALSKGRGRPFHSVFTSISENTSNSTPMIGLPDCGDSMPEYSCDPKKRNISDWRNAWSSHRHVNLNEHPMKIRMRSPQPKNTLNNSLMDSSNSSYGTNNSSFKSENREPATKGEVHGRPSPTCLSEGDNSYMGADYANLKTPPSVTKNNHLQRRRSLRSVDNLSEILPSNSINSNNSIQSSPGSLQEICDRNEAGNSSGSSPFNNKARKSSIKNDTSSTGHIRTEIETLAVGKEFLYIQSTSQFVLKRAMDILSEHLVVQTKPTQQVPFQGTAMNISDSNNNKTTKSRDVEMSEGKLHTPPDTTAASHVPLPDDIWSDGDDACFEAEIHNSVPGYFAEDNCLATSTPAVTDALPNDLEISSINSTSINESTALNCAFASDNWTNSSNSTVERSESIDLEHLVNHDMELTDSSILRRSLSEPLDALLNTTRRSFSGESKDSYGFKQPSNLIRIPLNPLASARDVHIVEASQPMTTLCAAERRKFFKITAANYIRRIQSERTEQEVLHYGRNFLLACARSPLARVPPHDWQDKRNLPDVCLSKAKHYFHPKYYESPEKSLHIERHWQQQRMSPLKTCSSDFYYIENELPRYYN